ncbi:rRNA biogenesis protein rrp36 [Aspergillus bombycis]|uniref:rRNA biogenesis protein RRP36 n=1 Tax=Aspergillus bombycis TaxID=109264 RepID=A0A1F8AEU6_9EURO|nr:rRNA biogenesis protein rrp36 [Aspergillus bombycis]OGM50286.1 rRNA biogenesis protein rrp36 [Aspergillus bombycis]
MAISDLLNRRVRALPEDDEEIYSEESASEEGSDDGRSGESDSGSDDLDNEALEETDDNSEHDEPVDSEDDEDSDDDDNGEDDVQASLSSISFGALAKAQASLGPKAKRHAKIAKPTEASPPTTSPLDDIRARIREAREQKRQESGKSKDSAKPARTSKHAPMVQSSKRAVSRKRTVVEPPSVPKSRDPRFDPTVLSQGGRHDAETARKAYSFLDDYRSSELKELRARFAKTKHAEEKEALKREIRSTSDRLRAIENRRREEEVIAEHKKREKQLIREGKKSNPYFLKKSDLKKQVMLKKYENMNSKERTKALERRRKKIASKERKEMPMERRFGSEGNDDGGRKRRRMA